MRALLREFGVTAPVGAAKFLDRLPQLLEQKREKVPERVRRVVLALWVEAHDLREKMSKVEKEIEALAHEHPVIQSLLQIPGIGVITATALSASGGDVHLFQSGRHLASWLGLTPQENSSGSRRRMGRISKQGDSDLRPLLIHGARSALTAAQLRQRSGQPLTHLQHGAVEKAEELRHSNPAAVARATKLARLCWAVWRHERSLDGHHALQAA